MSPSDTSALSPVPRGGAHLPPYLDESKLALLTPCLVSMSEFHEQGKLDKTMNLYQMCVLSAIVRLEQAHDSGTLRYDKQVYRYKRH